MNIITGDSGTGKSSIIDIVDYCLASGECRVKEGPIRRRVAWFAVELQTNSGSVLIARRAPEKGRDYSNDVFIERDPESIPSASSIEPVTNTLGLGAFLTELAGIPRTADPEASLAPSYSATVRHASRLLYQTQNEISSPSRLFHREDEEFARASIRDTLPFFLGAVTAEDLILARTLGDKRREMRRVQERLREVEDLADLNGSRAANLASEAASLGILEGPFQEGLGRIEAIELLRSVSRQTLENNAEEVSEVSSRIRSRRSTLRDELRSLREEYELVQEHLTSASDFFEVRSAFGLAALEQTERLALGAELPESNPDLEECPLCRSQINVNLPSQAEVLHSLSSLRATVDAFAQEPPQLSALVEDLRANASNMRQRMMAIGEELESLHQQEKRTNQESEQRDQKLLWFGRTTLFLESVHDETGLEDLRMHLARVALEVEELNQRLGKDAVRERMASIQSRLSQSMTAAAAPLELEWSAFPIRFDARELTVIVDGPDGPIPLKRIGSGEAWVAYHMVAHLALHEHYSRNSRPVPRMLFLDQPSQVYFPRESEAVTVPQERVGDMAAAERLLRVAFDALKGEASFQVIMTEHAEIDEAWFRESIVENWRGGDALIPSEWL